MRLDCSCEVTFERWATAEVADRDSGTPCCRSSVPELAPQGSAPRRVHLLVTALGLRLEMPLKQGRSPSPPQHLFPFPYLVLTAIIIAQECNPSGGVLMTVCVARCVMAERPSCW